MDIKLLISKGETFKNNFEFSQGTFQNYINDNSKLDYRTWIRTCIIYFEKCGLKNSVVIQVITKFKNDTDNTDSEDYYKNILATLSAIQPFIEEQNKFVESIYNLND